jgi:predicted nuclease of predicted toxin-antitoxin system
MRFLADENFPGKAVGAIRDAGHDVVWVREWSPGISDGNILAFAIAEQRIVLTFDKDFGELAFKSKLSASCGIIPLRFRKQSPDFVAQRIVTSITSRTDWEGNFAVIDEGRIRMTPLVRTDSTAGRIHRSGE